MQPNHVSRPFEGLLLFFLFLLVACKKDQPGQQPEPTNEAPVIVSFDPVSGPVGSTVVVAGTGFGGDPAKLHVQFNGATAAIASATASTITVVVPSGANTGKIAVTKSGTTVLSATSFTVTQGNGEQPPPTGAAWTASTFSGTGTSGSVDGPANTASFGGPKGMAVDATGNLYVADAFAHKIRKISPQGVVSTVAGTGARGMTNGNALTEATFNHPLDVALDGIGNIYVADGSNHAIRKITPAGVVSTLAGTGNYGYADGTAATAQFSTPYGLAVDDVGNVYVGDHANHRIRKITPGGSVVTVAGNGSSNSSDGFGTAAGISWPGGIALDEENNLYVAEKGGGRIRKIALTGQVTTLGGYLSVNAGPCHLAVDQDKNLYVLYRGFHRLQKFSPAGVETTVIGTGDPGNAEGAQASFRHPEGLAMMQNAQGAITFFIADTENKKIRKVALQ